MIRNFLRSIGVIGADKKTDSAPNTATPTAKPTNNKDNKEKAQAKTTSNNQNGDRGAAKPNNDKANNGSGLVALLGFKPNDYSYYMLALHHGSLNNGVPNNERLEFLGDAVLSAVVSHILYEKYRNKREGFLSALRSRLVQRETLNKLAKDIGLDRLMQVNQNITTAHLNIYGNAFEALIGAIYLDKGFGACMTFMKEKIFAHYLNIDKIERKDINYKSELLEWAQKHRHNLDYQMIDEVVDEKYNNVFKVKVLIDGKECGAANGYSKREAQQGAAKVALAYIRKNGREFARTRHQEYSRSDRAETVANEENTQATEIATDNE